MRRILLAALLTVSPAAAQTPFADTYDLFVGGFRAAEMSLRVEWTGNRYEAATAIRARGLAALLVSAEATAEAEGVATPAGLAPTAFAAEGTFGRTRQRVDMAYGAASPLPMQADPPLRPRAQDPAPETLRGALDPLSAAVATLTPRPVAEACNKTVPVFDSRRRYDLRLGAPRPDRGMLRCDGVFVRVAGFKRLEATDNDGFSLWWRIVDGLARLERAVAYTDLGAAVATRRRADP